MLDQKGAKMALDLPLDAFLKEVGDAGASDLHISAGSPVMLRIDGELRPTTLAPDHKLTPEESFALCVSKINEDLTNQLKENLELDYAFNFGEDSRFRANIFYQFGSVAGAFRPIPNKIPTLEEMNLPAILGDLTRVPRGLVLVTGPTGSGKSTTLASMIGEINRTRGDHILTIEDPVEFVHKSSRSLVAQREVAKDTHSFLNALKYALRQDPDVVLIGEMRDYETINAAITISETGHLVFATLHTNSAVETINRIINVFPPHQQGQVRTQLSFVLQGIVSQQLIPKVNGGRALAQEIMIPNLAIRNLIREDKAHQIYTSMQVGQRDSGMMTMNQSLANLCKQKLISKELAIERATNAEEVRKLLGMTA